ncbi:MAG: hypothetical protein N2169_07350, partial [bacterium]|nr:hypothetical protein [bacterium]
PHGDSSVYEALVRMAQEFTLTYPLVWGQGNFGSIDGDPAAAYRYTEARLTEIGTMMLKDIDLNTVDFRSNFDDSTTEPIVLPSAFPNLLVNGSTGIAVGMVTNIPPHNLNEIEDSCILLLEKPQANIKEIIEIIKGPDFPTGGIVYTSKIIKSIYQTGKGILKIEGKYKIENIQKKEYLVIYEIPYSINKSKLVKEIAEAIKEKKIPEVIDVIDQSNNKEIKILLELKQPYNEKNIVNYLKNFTSFRSTFYCSFIAVDGHIPKQYSITDLIKKYIDHRKEVNIRKAKDLLEKNSQKAFLLKALIKATQNIDKLIKIIRTSPDYKTALLNLMAHLQINHKQAEHILNLQLHRLTKLETNKLMQDYNQTIQKIKELSETLDNENKLKEIIKQELIEIKNKYGKERRTEIAQSDNFKQIKIEKPQTTEDLIVLGLSNGYLNSFKSNTKPEKLFGNISNYNYITSILETNSKQKIVVFLSNGKYTLFDLSKFIDNSIFIPKFYKSEDNTKVIFLTTSKKLQKHQKVVIVTKKGMVKSINTNEITDISRISIYIKLDHDDEVINIIPVQENQTILGITEMGFAFKIKTQEIPEYSKTAKGVKIVTLKENDNIFNAESINDLYECQIVFLTSNGFLTFSSNNIEYLSRGRNITEKNRIIPKQEKSSLSLHSRFGLFSTDKTKRNLVITEKEILILNTLEENKIQEATLINYLGNTY